MTRKGLLTTAACTAGALLVLLLLALMIKDVNQYTIQALNAVPPMSKQLQAEGYAQYRSEQHFSREANHTVTTQWWTRAKAPELVIVSDDSPDAANDVLTPNAIIFNGSDGNGQLTCQPKWGQTYAPLERQIADATRVRSDASAGRLKPNENGLPYSGTVVDCGP